MSFCLDYMCHTLASGWLSGFLVLLGVAFGWIVRGLVRRP